MDNNFLHDIEAAKAGDRSALDRVLRLVEQRGLARAGQGLGPALAARVRRSDVVQCAWMEILRSLSDFRGHDEGSFLSWVDTIIDHSLKRLSRFHQAQRRSEPTNPEEAREIIEARSRSTATPSTVAANLEDLTCAVEALDRLPDTYREVIRLAVIEGRPHQEVAAILGKEAGATRMLLSRARVALASEVRKLNPRT